MFCQVSISHSFYIAFCLYSCNNLSLVEVETFKEKDLMLGSLNSTSGNIFKVFKVFEKRQKCLQNCEKLLNNYRKKIKKQVFNSIQANYCRLNFYSFQIKFIPSEFCFSEKEFGKLENGYLSSKIMTREEVAALNEITKAVYSNLIYRASEDGFEASNFHLKCDGKSNTVTVIKNNLDHVFGGFASVAWNKPYYIQSYIQLPSLLNKKNDWIYDPCAYIFSLRRSGIFSNKIFKVTDSKKAIYSNKNYGPSFGCDITINDRSNTVVGSYCDIGCSYDRESIGFPYKSVHARSFLAGHFNAWKTTEIEVYEIYH